MGPTMSTTIARMSFGALTFLLALSAVTAAAYAADNQINVVSQKVTRNEVTVASVTTTEDALIVIYPINKSDAPALGYAAVKAGESTNVKVPLEQPVSPGTRLIAVLYADAGEKGRFEPGTDKPIVRPVVRPVSNRFTVK